LGDGWLRTRDEVPSRVRPAVSLTLRASLELGRSDDRFEVLLRTRGSHIIIITAAAAAAATNIQ
tara:strand:+ start:2074 stop:2265 length:192 start_codon:yes stop_codon:yes gene_type:complete